MPKPATNAASARSRCEDQMAVLLRALTALKKGDGSFTLPDDWEGAAGKVADVYRDLQDLSLRMADQLETLSRKVGKEGKLSRRGEMGDVRGFWKTKIDSVNMLIDDLVLPLSETSRVIGAVAQGNLSQTVALEFEGQPLQGEFLRQAKTINKMVDQLGSFASEVTRVAREVGTDGKLGGQARVKGVAGTWKDLTDSVNSMAGNLTGQVRNIAEVTTAVARGDLSKKVTVDVKGEILELKNTVNTMVDQLSTFAAEVTRMAREVGTDGKLGGQAWVKGVAGTWKDLTDSVNSMAGNLTSQVRNVAEVTTAVARGDLSKKITVDVRGEFLELKNTINTMVDQLRSFGSEVTRVAREVGTEGQLGGQARVEGVSGTWKDLTDNVNFMAGNLTSQVRGIAKVVTAVADGDLRLKLTVEAKGEIAALANTINNMIETLATFADQVTGVAREVGVEGKLGGQARVPGASGTWKDLTENVNQLAANLTSQVRAIAQVATAVTQGDLTRSITVEAQGEVAALKDTINEMIRNLKDTTQKNTEQDWLKTNLAKFSRMLQGQKNINTVGSLILSELAPVVSAQVARFYVLDTAFEQAQLRLLASYGALGSRSHGRPLQLGEGLVGQCAAEKRKSIVSQVPEGYLDITSGLGAATPRNLLVLPVVFEGQVKGVLELGSFDRFPETHQTFLEQLMESVGIVINTIEANMRTEDLLTQSQSLAQELGSRQEELQNTNQELQEKARLLAHQNQEVERKNAEVEQARQDLEEKARQLALTSKYKSEFLANMSHELRTPLNSLLILSDQLQGNAQGNLTGKQVEFAKTIHSSGNDLLTLINDILDLSKIESGTVAVDVGELRLDEMRRYVERTFRHVAEAKKLDFFIRADERLPAVMATDSKRLQQIIKNLLSNAFKFTHRGQVTLSIESADSGWNPDNEDLNRAAGVVAFTVRDTGIGISPDKQQIIFEAFQQADGSTSRKYGGTGLGLAISRELARLLGGEIRLTSAPGEGSVFTLYLPERYAPPRPRKNAPDATTAADAAIRAARAPLVRAEVPAADAPEPVPEANETNDDRQSIQPGDAVLLVVENDHAFAAVLLDAARDRGFKGIVTSLGASAISLAREFRPSAITLDIHLSDIQGWRVLDRLKGDIETRHIPVCVISTEDSREQALQSGALHFVAKPLQSRDMVDRLLDSIKAYASRDVKNLLVVQPDPRKLENVLGYLMQADDLKVTGASDAKSALLALRSGDVDCLVVDPEVPGLGASALIDETRHHAAGQPVPIIVHAQDGRPGPDDATWQKLSRAGPVCWVHTLDRLLDQTTVYLHRDASRLPQAQRGTLEGIYLANRWLAGRKVLLVDDDMRNIFALSTVLEDYEMEILTANNGADAIELVKGDPAIDIVLMDIMMPEMDGLETMREIRKLDGGKDLPIIAVTAKAMKGDRQRCLEAGAWDYLAKPVETQQLLATLRAWLKP